MAPDDRERSERMASALRREELEQAAREGKPISNSLLLQLLNDLNIVEVKLSNAEKQRLHIDEKVDNILQEIRMVPRLADRMESMTRQLSEMQTEMRLNTEFRLQFLGGSVVFKVLWIALGAAVGGVIQYFWTKGH